MQIIFEPLHKSFTLPKKGSEHAAGWDMVACIDEPIMLGLGERVAVPLGCRANIPIGYSIEVLPRSGLAVKNGLTVLNGPGLIDADYRGEWHAIVVFASNTCLEKTENKTHSSLPAEVSWEPTYTKGFVINPGMKICQIVLRKVEDLEASLGSVDIDTVRGASGFGSTGT